MKKCFLLLAFVLLAIAQTASAAVPDKISYQGLLKTSSGDLVPDGSYNISFAVYSAGSGGTPLWSETQTLGVADGVFNALLGNVNPLGLDFTIPYWLGITIESDPELTPRVELSSSAYALNSDRLDGLHGSDYSLSGHTHLLGSLSDVNVSGAAGGDVLTYDAASLQWIPTTVSAGDDGDWTISGDDVYRSVGSVGIGGPPLRPVPDSSKGGNPQPRSPATTKLMVDGTNEGIFASLTETDDLADDRAAVYGYRTRTMGNAGTGYAAGESNAGVIGENFWGDNYTFGVAGYNYNDYGSCAAVMGANWSGSYWGALAYKDTGGLTWGTYTPSNSYTGGSLTVNGALYANGMIRCIGNFGSGYSGTAIVAENTNAGGIALWAKTSGSDATVVVDQYGTGDMMRGFLNGALKFRVLNNGSVVTPLLQITGGSDLAEPFEVDGRQRIPAGSLLVIDENHPGKLKLSQSEYDSKVAGVVSGAGGVHPGLTMNQKSVFEEGRNLALSGRAYARATTSNGPIHPGDLLTTSGRSGYAMKATDPERSHGAIIGKAMSSLEDGEGLVLVLVNLQ